MKTNRNSEKQTQACGGAASSRTAVVRRCVGVRGTQPTRVRASVRGAGKGEGGSLFGILQRPRENSDGDACVCLCASGGPREETCRKRVARARLLAGLCRPSSWRHMPSACLARKPRLPAHCQEGMRGSIVLRATVSACPWTGPSSLPFHHLDCSPQSSAFTAFTLSPPFALYSTPATRLHTQEPSCLSSSPPSTSRTLSQHISLLLDRHYHRHRSTLSWCWSDCVCGNSERDRLSAPPSPLHRALSRRCRCACVPVHAIPRTRAAPPP